MHRNVAMILGSLRKDSFNRKMALALAALAPTNLACEIVEIGDLPFFNQDSENTPPPSVIAFKARIERADAVLFVTPEYNRSVPGVLKNAIDVGSRPSGKSAWSGKPAAVLSVSPGAIGGFGANHHLRQSLVFLDMPTMAQPEAYVGEAGEMFGPDGAILSESTRTFVRTFAEHFARWIERNNAG